MGGGVDAALRERPARGRHRAVLLLGEPVQESEVGADPVREVHPTGAQSLFRYRGAPGVDADDPGWVTATSPVQDAGPEHGLGVRHVVAEQEDRVAVLDVGVGAGLTVRAEGLLHRRHCGGGAQSGVAVHVRGAETRLPEHPVGVVLLDEHLTGGVEAVCQGPVLLEKPLGYLHDPTRGGIPVGLHEAAAFADQGTGQPVR